MTDPSTETAALLHRFALDDIFYIESFCRIMDENDVLVPFRLANRPMQVDFNKRVLIPKIPKVVELKARRVGGTSLFMALGLVRAMRRKNYGVLLLAQSDEDTMRFMRRGFKRLYEDMVGRVRMPDGSVFVPRAETEAYSDHLITFPKTGSYIMVATAGSIKVGRGQGFDYVIGTEVARWDVGHPPGTADECWSMVVGSQADKAEPLAIQESTAYGAIGHFYDTYQGAKRGENGYLALFYNWRCHPAYQLPQGDLRALEADRGPLVLDEDETRLGLTDNQSRWRRATIVGMPGGSYATKLALFLQEFPEDDETCFRMSGDPYFDADVIDRKIREARPCLTTSESGGLRIWQTPHIGEKYIVAVDPGGQGVERRYASQERDYDAVGVFDSRLTHVATLRGRWDARTFAQMLADLAAYYNYAIIISESGPWGEAVLLALTSYLGYKNIYYERDEHGKPLRAGMRIGGHNKPQLASTLKELFENGTLRTDDKVLLAEMRNYHRVPSASGNIRLEARAGHDDLVCMAQLAAWCWSQGKFGVGASHGTIIHLPGRRVLRPPDVHKPSPSGFTDTLQRDMLESLEERSG